MDLLEKYKKYRNIQVLLHSKILDKCSTFDDMRTSIRMLGIQIEHGRDIILESPMEQDAILEFTVYGKIGNGKSALNQYIEQKNEASPDEAAVLLAMEKSEASLYEVVEVNMEEKVIGLRDVLNPKGTVKVIDIGLSETLFEGGLIFTRLLSLHSFSMTAGTGFIFSKNYKQYLIKRSKKLIKKINTGDMSTDRYIAFFQLNRSDGLLAVPEKVE